ncbi:MAG: hypothetical protein A2W04_09600 [Betaproteobacteria bacterium RBG_16_64_9]|nr:MAG: hypothetical protein A2W04_09600 [Betaproteobacteria bacterium RBG_16_64_9]OGA28337.1 MAG: hypothetical protein A3I01_04510 [Betaproteobacteria bacterium RIFCSPLOWO2_02_FULL_65_24]
MTEDFQSKLDAIRTNRAVQWRYEILTGLGDHAQKRTENGAAEIRARFLMTSRKFLLPGRARRGTEVEDQPK